MVSPETPRPRPRSSRSLRGLAAIAALVVGGSLVGFTTARAADARPTQGSGSFDTNAIAAKVDPAVVDVNTTLAGGQGQAAGTGMVITSSGEVLTNNHVIENASDIRVQIGGTGRSYSAEVLGYNVGEDVALLKIDGVSGLKTVATDTTVSVGESVVAIGNGGGRGGTPDATGGSVTALGETITVSDTTGAGSQQLRNLIRVDASLQPGDSGGPLADADGEVVGMNTAASSGGFRLRAGSATGYAIPIKTALSVAQQIESGQGSGDTHVGERAFLGVSIQDLSARGRSRSSSSAVVAGVQSGSPADRAGLRQGDVIVSLAGKTINSLDDLTSALAPHHPRDKVDVGWTNASGSHHTATVTLASGPPA